MILRVYSDPVLRALELSGWCPERDVFDSLFLSKKKKIFAGSKEVLGLFGLLKLSFIGDDGDQVIYFDVDDSEVSKNMKAEIFGYNSYKDPKLLNEPDFNVSENVEWTNLVEEFVGQPCARIGFLETQFGFNIYVAENRSIYIAHGTEPQFAALNIIDFLNTTILSVN